MTAIPHPEEPVAASETQSTGSATSVGEGLRTHPASIAIGTLKGLPNALFGLAAVAFAGDLVSREYLYIGGLAVGVALLMLFFAWLSWRRRTYIVGETDIRVEAGIVSRQARSVPYERIQDVSLEQGLLPRLFGLVQVRFETGAGGKDELALAYLTEDEGERLRETVRARRDGHEAAPAADDSESPLQEPPPLFAMPPKRILTFGLFEFSLAVFAVLFGLLQQYGDALPFDVWESSFWKELMVGPGEQIASLGPMAQAIGIVMALLSVAVLGVATGLVRTTLREWNFRLDRTEKGFRRRRGLLTKTDVVMPAHRVQAVTVGTGLIRRRFGWHNLKFVSLAQDSGSANHVVAPFAKVEEIRPIAAAANFALPQGDLDWHRASSRYRFDSAVLNGLFMGVVALGVALSDYPWFAIIPLAIGALQVMRQAFLWRFERHALSETQLFRREGWLAPKLAVASRVKLQSVEIAQGPITKWRGYATLHLGLAGGKLSITGISLDRAQSLRTAILESIAQTDFSELVDAPPASTISARPAG
ncbi:UPF0699 transmembrane protein YdbT [Alteripontixanthobacter maritimus]|uniref:UPF0699 transmembrane protein YdbT n=1 Tax=Alteripontixanthobacter maritimus TaxID=2161824 RepID=A0A369Q9B4_9SPHN|nr:PH domain-containing protein [Alteripontixanthobacter maritimus]RDC61072.1 UPF0699 transmembrane protein YdbT [Alteripontixanthobacter maritimus]